MVPPVAFLAYSAVPWVLSAALSVAPVPWVPPVAFLAYSADPVVPPVVVAIAPVPGSPRLIGVLVPLALIAASHRGSDAGSGRDPRSSSSLLYRAMSSALSSDGVVALDPVRC